jgi:hypothetical protein
MAEEGTWGLEFDSHMRWVALGEEDIAMVEAVGREVALGVLGPEAWVVGRRIEIVGGMGVGVYYCRPWSSLRGSSPCLVRRGVEAGLCWEAVLLGGRVDSQGSCLKLEIGDAGVLGLVRW